MGWTVEIEHSAGTVTFDASFSFLPQAEKSLNAARSVVEYVDTFFNLRGDVVAATPADVSERTKEIFDLVAAKLTPVNLTIKLDGVEQWAYTPGSALAGPMVMSFEPAPDQGNGGSHWRYELVLFVRTRGNNFGGLHDLRSALTVTTNISKSITRKVWEVTARASTVTAALAGVMRFKPQGKVSEEIRKDYDLNSVSAIWVWRLTTLTFEERISIIGGGKSYIVDRQAGVNAKPLLHLARRGAHVIRLDGIARGLEGEKLAPPPAHWKESATLKRMSAQEDQSFPTYASEEDRELGILTLPYSEVWVCTADKVPAPNHGTHAKSPGTVTVPADGVINR
jgi:hypothetical protein